MPFDLHLVKPSNRVFRRRNSSVGRIYDDGQLQLMSVTTFLSNTAPAEDEEALENWKRNVGEEQAKLISQTSMSRGTNLHKALEQYLLGEENPKIFGADVRMLFKSLKNEISQHLKAVFGVELQLYSETLGLAGTTDCVGMWDKDLAIVDWKNSRNEKAVSDIDDYFIQATAYALMFFERYGIMPKKLVIVLFTIGGNSKFYVKNTSEYIQKFNKRLMIAKQMFFPISEKVQLGEFENE